ncbi:MAG: HlyD family efflux transporter periplasmic adaptor subunit [Chlorobium phaeovibrioides]|nr:HlyD family efflux transporter periplasmic adaptor subunit [Chlorobium phaeovibrioides]
MPSIRILAPLGVAVAALMLFFVFRPAPLLVDSAVIEEGALRVRLEEEGMTRVKDLFVVAAPVSGMLLRIDAREGDSVKTGAELALLLPPELDARQYRETSFQAMAAEAALSEARARLRRVELDAEQTGRRAVRYRNLFGEGAISRESFELAVNDSAMYSREIASAGSAVEAARFTYRARKAAIDPVLSRKPVVVHSPAEGRVLRIHEKSRRAVTVGTPLLDLGNPDSIEVVIDLLSADAVSVKPGHTVEVIDWGGPGLLTGLVTKIEPAAFTKISALGVEEKRVNVVARLDRAAPGLGDNFRIQTRIVVESAGRVVKVPISALFRVSDQWHVFSVDNNRAIEKQVSIGMQGTREAEVLDGIEVGERVVVHPSSELHEGMRVTFQR